VAGLGVSRSHYVATVATLVLVFRNNQDLLNERFKLPVQEGQPLADKILVVLLVLLYCGVILLIPFDVFRFHWFEAWSDRISVGFTAISGGWIIISLSFRANPAIPAVKLQTDRHQTVVDTGAYSVARHPMYAGAILTMYRDVALAGIVCGGFIAIIPSGLLIVRILIEEQVLRQDLTGYDAYTKRIRYRLIPLLW